MKPMQVRVYAEDLPIIVKIQEHTGISNYGQVVRAALRAYLRELGLAAAPVKPHTARRA